MASTIRVSRLSESSSESEEPTPPPPKPAPPPPKKGKSENKAAKAQKAYAEELDRKFAQRYTLEDDDYAKTLQERPTPIPLLPEYQGRNFRGGFRGGDRGRRGRRFND